MNKNLEDLTPTQIHYKIYQLENRDRLNEYQRQWRKNNPEKSAEMSRRYRKKNSEIVKQRKKEYYLKHKEEIRKKQKELYQRKKEKELDKVEINEILNKIKEVKDVLPTQIINGYYVRTVFCEIVGEVSIRVLFVYKNEDSNDIIQYNIDAVNLGGVLLCSDCFEPADFDKDCYELAENVFKYIKIAQRK